MDQPLSVLNGFKGKNVLVVLKGNKEVSGILEAIDLNTNVTLNIDGVSQLIQGNTVMLISLQQ